MPGSLPCQSFEETASRTPLAAGNEDGSGRLHVPCFRGAAALLRLGDGSCATAARRRRIDWILLKNDAERRLRIGAHAILRDRDERSGIYPSDHYPALATLIPTG